jgi:hypothetical protein
MCAEQAMLALLSEGSNAVDPRLGVVGRAVVAAADGGSVSPPTLGEL